MIDQKLLISGLASTPFLGGGLTGALLSVNSAENGKEIIRTPFKDELLKKGFKISKSHGVSIWILRQYSDFPENINDLGSWCKKHETISEKENPELRKQFQEFCFETIATEIDSGLELAILKVGRSEDEDASDWSLAFEKFKKAFQNGSEKSPSNSWQTTQQLDGFKKQCKKNERVPYINENKALFEEVKSYCTRKKNLRSAR